MEGLTDKERAVARRALTMAANAWESKAEAYAQNATRDSRRLTPAQRNEAIATLQSMVDTARSAASKLKQAPEVH